MRHGAIQLSPRRAASCLMLCATLLASAGPRADYAAGLAAFTAGDYGLAIAEFTPLANQGDADAQFHLGIAYQKGWGVIADPAKAAAFKKRLTERIPLPEMPGRQKRKRRRGDDEESVPLPGKVMHPAVYYVATTGVLMLLFWLMVSLTNL